MADCVVRFLTGNTITIKDCATALDARVKIAARFKTLYPHIILLDTADACVLEDDFSFLPHNDPSDVHVTAIIINEPTGSPDFSVHEWRHILRMHACIGDVSGLRRAMDGPGTEVDNDRRERMLWHMQHILFDELRGYCNPQQSSTTIITSLVQAGVDINIRDRYDIYGRTPLIYVVQACVHDMVNPVALPETSRLSDRDNTSGETAEVLRMLLDSKADVDMCTKFGWNALICAAENNHRDVVQLLLEYGADVNHEGPCGWRPLDFAIREGHTEVEDLLLQYNAEVNCSLQKQRDVSHICSDVALLSA